MLFLLRLLSSKKWFFLDSSFSPWLFAFFSGNSFLYVGGSTFLFCVKCIPGGAVCAVGIFVVAGTVDATRVGAIVFVGAAGAVVATGIIGAFGAVGATGIVGAT